MKLLFIVFFLLSYYFAFSQSKVCYSSTKIDKLVKAIKVPKESDLIDDLNFERKIPNKIFDNLNASELIYYCTNYPESATQICVDDTGYDNFKSFIYITWLYFPNYSYIYSERQKKALLKKEIEVIKLIDSCYKKTGILSDDYKFLIVEAKLMKGISILLNDVNKIGFKNSSSCSAIMDLINSDHNYDKIFAKSKLFKLFNAKQDSDNPIPNNLTNRNLIIEEAKKFMTYKKI